MHNFPSSALRVAALCIVGVAAPGGFCAESPKDTKVEDFEDGIPDGWDVMAGGFDVTRHGSGQVFRAHAANRLNDVTFGHYYWEDSVTRLRFKFQGWGSEPQDHWGISSRYFGVAVRYRAWKRYHAFQFTDKGIVRIIRRAHKGDRDTVVLASAEFALEKDRWYTLTAEVKGTDFKLSIDDKLVLRAADDHPEMKHGRGGIVSQFAEVLWDDVKVEATPAPEKEPGRVVALSEDFAPPRMLILDVRGGSGITYGAWHVHSDDSVDKTPHLNTRNLHATVVQGDFSLSVDATAVEGNTKHDDFAVVFGYQDTHNYYYAQFCESDTDDGPAKQNGLFKVEKGVVAELGKFPEMIKPGTSPKGGKLPYQARVERKGDTLRVFLNKKLWGEARDTTFGEGRVGFGLRQTPGSYARAYFDNLVVQTPSKAGGPADRVLISEDFEYASAGFEPVGAEWGLIKGWYFVELTDRTAEGVLLRNRTVHKKPIAGDFVLTATGSARSTTAKSPDNFAVLFNFKDANNYYCVSLAEKDGEDVHGTFKVADGKLTELLNFGNKGTYFTEWPQIVRIEREGDTIKVFANSELLGSVTDATHKGGRIGLGSRMNYGWFDDLVVTVPAKAGQPAPDQPKPVRPPPKPANALRLEAEGAPTRGPGMDFLAVSGYSGVGFIDYEAKKGGFLEWATVTVPAAGKYRLTLRYTNGEKGPNLNRVLELHANGKAAGEFKCAPTEDWANWTTETITVELPAGKLALKLFAAGKGPNTDYLDIEPGEGVKIPAALTADTLDLQELLAKTTSPAVSPKAKRYEAEAADSGDAEVEAKHTGFSGEGYVNYPHEPGATNGWKAVKVPAAGNYKVTVGFSNAGKEDRVLELVVNGKPAGKFTCRPTGSWKTWATAEVVIPLSAGANAVTLRAPVDGPNVDYIDVEPAAADPKK